MAAATTLWKNDGAETLRYLKEQRGLSEDVIREFNFGYCPVSSGHQLAGRIIMPLYDAYGILIAITSRNINCEKKYQHWHESFDKSAFLFGLNVAKKNIYRVKKAIIVEGQFDATCLHTYGFNMTVGLLGSAFNIMHVTLLARMCPEVYMVLDPDDSGEEGIARAKRDARNYRLNTYGIHLIPVVVPEKKDPDEFVIKYGATSFVDLLKKAKEKYGNRS